ncbi:hypothetical protein F4680DRAFT_411414 [Xylaria scruposa]|nr:hypothetical protein F4680DRAFT_411414 [Xylaria scruposa]
MKGLFDDSMFDGAYAIEATAYAPDLRTVYGEIFRVLRPGARFAVYEVVLARGYREDNPVHRGIRQAYERAFAAPPIRNSEAAVKAMKAAGFEIELAEDLAVRPGGMPWYYPIDGSYGWMTSLSDTFAKNYYSFLINSFRSSGIVYRLMGALETLKILPSGAQMEASQVVRSLNVLRKAGEEGIITPMFLMVGKKSES